MKKKYYLKLRKNCNVVKHLEVIDFTLDETDNTYKEYTPLNKDPKNYYMPFWYNCGIKLNEGIIITGLE